MSYDRHLYFALTADLRVLTDLDLLATFVGEAFAELADAAGVGEVPATPPAMYAAARSEPAAPFAITAPPAEA
jgi:hypothetical protein